MYILFLETVFHHCLYPLNKAQHRKLKAKIFTLSEK